MPLTIGEVSAKAGCSVHVTFDEHTRRPRLPTREEWAELEVGIMFIVYEQLPDGKTGVSLVLKGVVSDYDEVLGQYDPAGIRQCRLLDPRGIPARWPS